MSHPSNDSFNDFYADRHNIEEFADWLADSDIDAKGVSKDEWSAWVDSKWADNEYQARFESYLRAWWEGVSSQWEDEPDDRE